MKGWSTHTGQVVALPVDNIDTDQLIPARFMSRPRSDGYGDYLLYDYRNHADGQSNPDFALNKHPQASILVTGGNFGSGSSREAAVYALVDAGIRAVISTGFGDIFTANSTNNALLCARISDADHTRLLSSIESSDATLATMEVDIPTRTITLGAHMMSFSLDDASCAKIINGWDDIDLTNHHQTSISAFGQTRWQQYPWSRPGKGHLG